MPPLWNENDISTAKNFLQAMHKLAGTFGEKKDTAARSVGSTEGYMGLSDGTRKYISHLGQVAKTKKQDAIYKERLQHNLKLMEEDWERLYNTDPNFRHAMTHPDDE
jgi:hypothetical protein